MNIQEIHESVFKFLLKKRESNPSLRYNLRFQNDEKWRKVIGFTTPQLIRTCTLLFGTNSDSITGFLFQQSVSQLIKTVRLNLELMKATIAVNQDLFAPLPLLKEENEVGKEALKDDFESVAEQ